MKDMKTKGFININVGQKIIKKTYKISFLCISFSLNKIYDFINIIQEMHLK